MIVRTLLSIAILAAAATVAGGQTLVPWRHGTVAPKGDAGFFYMAAEGGFAKAEGLELKMLAFQNDTLMLKALVAGELDTFEGSPISPMIAGSKGADVKILGCSWPRLTYSFFSRAEIGSLAELKGKTIGISAPGSLPDYVARAMLRQAGVLPADAKFVMAGSDPERIRAIMAKTIDAAISTSDFAARPELGLKTLARAGDALPSFVRTCFSTRGELARTRPEQLAAFMAAEMKAYAHALTHRDAVIALARRIAGLRDNDPTPAANFDEVVAHQSVSPEIEIDRAKFIWLRDLLAEDGRIAATFDPATLIDGSIRERALAR
jgi:NitT/TauT family transport system substrate-binding protein